MNPVVHDIAAILTIGAFFISIIHWIIRKVRPSVRRRIVIFLRKLRDEIDASDK